MIEEVEIRQTQAYNDENSELQLDVVNPEKDIRIRITALVDTVKKFHGEYIKTRKTIKEQLGEVLDFGLHKYKMDPTYLRNLIKEVFEERGADPSWIRKLLPKELKDSSKIRLDYKQKQEQQQKQDLQEPQLQKEENIVQVPSEANNTEAEHTKNIAKTPLATTNTHVTSADIVALESKLKSPEEELREANGQIKELLEQVRRLSEPFTANVYLQLKKIRLPLIARIDPLKKVVTSIQVDMALYSKMRKEESN